MVTAKRLPVLILLAQVIVLTTTSTNEGATKNDKYKLIEQPTVEIMVASTTKELEKPLFTTKKIQSFQPDYEYPIRLMYNSPPELFDPYSILRFDPLSLSSPMAEERSLLSGDWGPTIIPQLLPWMKWGPHGYFNLCPYLVPGVDPVWSAGCAPIPFPQSASVIPPTITQSNDPNFGGGFGGGMGLGTSMSMGVGNGMVLGNGMGVGNGMAMGGGAGGYPFMNSNFFQMASPYPMQYPYAQNGGFPGMGMGGGGIGMYNYGNGGVGNGNFASYLSYSSQNGGPLQGYSVTFNGNNKQQKSGGPAASSSVKKKVKYED